MKDIWTGRADLAGPRSMTMQRPIGGLPVGICNHRCPSLPEGSGIDLIPHDWDALSAWNNSLPTKP